MVTHWGCFQWHKHMKIIKEPWQLIAGFRIAFKEWKIQGKNEGEDITLRMSFGSQEADQFAYVGIIDRSLPLFSGHVLLILIKNNSTSFFLIFSKPLQSSQVSVSWPACCLRAGEWGLGFWQLFVHLPLMYRTWKAICLLPPSWYSGKKQPSEGSTFLTFKDNQYYFLQPFSVYIKGEC